MLLVKNWPFFKRFILGNIRKENVFYNIRERKNGFLRYKKKNLEKWKNTVEVEIKLAIFQKFYFRVYRPGKCVLRYWITKKWLSKV